MKLYTVKYQRNHSLTRDEIDTYWKSKKQKEEEHNEIVSEVIIYVFKAIYIKFNKPIHGFKLNFYAA